MRRNAERQVAGGVVFGCVAFVFAAASRGDVAAVFGGDLHSPVQPRVYRVVSRFEGQHQQAAADRGTGVQERLGGVQQPAVRRVETGLRDRSGRGDRGGPVIERH